MAEGDYWFVEEYVRALDQNTDHECSGASGCHVVEIIMGIFESAAFGRHVDLPQVQRDHPLLRWREQAGLKAPDKMPLFKNLRISLSFWTLPLETLIK